MYMNQNELYIDKVVNIPIAGDETESQTLSGTGTTSYTFTFSPPVGYIAGYYTGNLTLRGTGNFLSSLKCQTYMTLSGTYRHVEGFSSPRYNTTFSKRCYVKDSNSNDVDPSAGYYDASYTFNYDARSYVRVA